MSQHPNLRLALCGLFLIVGPTLFLLGCAVILAGALRLFPDAVVVRSLVAFWMNAALGIHVAYAAAGLASIGPIVIIYALLNACRSATRDRATRATDRCRPSLETQRCGGYARPLRCD